MLCVAHMPTSDYLGYSCHLTLLILFANHYVSPFVYIYHNCLYLCFITIYSNQGWHSTAMAGSVASQYECSGFSAGCLLLTAPVMPLTPPCGQFVKVPQLPPTIQRHLV